MVGGRRHAAQRVQHEAGQRLVSAGRLFGKFGGGKLGRDTLDRAASPNAPLKMLIRVIPT